MQYGMYVAASGMLTSMHRMDVFANNLANTETVGFKIDNPMQRQRATATEERGNPSLPSSKLLEQLGGGVLMARNLVSFTQGALQRTEQPLDVAVEGDGFLVVRDGTGAGPDSLRFTRDGRLGLDSSGRLIQSASGRAVLDDQDRPITLASGVPVVIDADGSIKQGGEVVGKLQLATVDDPNSLRKRGDNMFAADAQTMGRKKPAEGASVTQGFVERSGADPVRAMMAFSSAERGVSGNARMISNYDELLNRTINTFGKMG